MARYEDLGPLDYFGAAWADRLVAVGWVESAEQCHGAGVDAAFVRALVGLLIEPWQPFAYAGFHKCTLCKLSGGPGTFHFEGRAVSLGANNLFVFGTDEVFVAPSTIVHYIDAHGYCPPQAFQDAVCVSPPMGSMDYLRQVSRHQLVRLGSPRAETDS